MKMPAMVQRAQLQALANKPLTRKVALWTIVVFAALGVLGFLVAPWASKSLIERAISEELLRPAHIGELSINPYALSATVRGFQLTEKDGQTPFVGFDELYVNLEGFESLLRLAPVLREVKLVNPRVRLVRNPDKSYNFSDILEAILAKPPKPEPTRFSVNNIQVSGGQIEFDDRPVDEKHTITDLRLGVPFVSNLPSKVDIFVEPSLGATVNGAPLALTGRSHPFAEARETELDLNVTDVDIPHYMDYVPVPLALSVPSGRLDAALRAAFRQPAGQGPALRISGKIAVRELAVADVQGQAVAKLARLDTDIAALNVFAREAEVSSVTLRAPELELKRARDGKLNVLGLIGRTAPATNSTGLAAQPLSGDKPPAAPQAADQPAAPDRKPAATTPSADSAPPPILAKQDAAPPFALRIAEIRIAEGKLGFTDEVPETPFRTTLQDISLGVKQFSLPGKEPASVELSLRSDADEAVRHSGHFTLAPVAAKGEVEISKVRLARYAPYYAPLLRFSVDEGSAGAGARYDVAMNGGVLEARAENIGFTLNGLKLTEAKQKQPLLTLESAALKDGSFDLGKREITVGEFVSSKARLNARREKDGNISLTQLLAEAPKGKEPASSAAPAKAEAPQWAVRVKRVALDGYGVRVDDLSLPGSLPIVVDPIRLTLENVSTARGEKASVDLKATVGRRGNLSAAGTVVAQPPQADVRLDARRLDLVPLQPYFADKVNVTLTRGAVSVQGQVSGRVGEAGAKPAEALRAGFRGTATLAEFHVVDRANSADLLKWQSLHFGGVKAGWAPLDLSVQEVALSDFYARVILDAEGRLNLREAARAPGRPDAAPAQAPAGNAPRAAGDAAATPTLAPGAGTAAAPTTQPGAVSPAQPAAAEAPPAAPAARTPAPPPDYKIRVDTVTLQGGNVNFSDLFIKPNYNANLTGLGGRVTGLSSDHGTRADVEIRAELDNAAPVQIAGQVNPLAGDLYVDLKAGVKGVEMSPFTPYSGKYAGYAIEKGKLSMDVAYKVEARKLEAQNRVFLDQLTFGEKIDSPTATKLPVQLAVSLLKNSRGEIDINLPISGSLDDPQFSVGGIIVKVILNLIVKAVTAPFALLGAAFGGGEELAYLEFDAGRNAIVKTGEAKLQTMAKALLDRPGLKLEITGRADPETDRDGARKAAVERKVKAQKLEELVKKGQDAGSADDITLTPEEYPRYLERAYKKESFAKPRNVIGLAKSLPADDMEKLMLTNTPVSDDDLRALAASRAQAARDWLVKTGNVPPERVFVLSPRVGADDGRNKAAEKAKGSRVDFSLR
ncbi:MAG: DUF748 domain-containing protein [Betaproteobacteria bacterium]|nr:DUF748 domain-containing protein [Betaproteobacteria bacterium]